MDSFLPAIANHSAREIVPQTTMAADGLKKIIISGAPASGKGTQCEKIKEKVELGIGSYACTCKAFPNNTVF